MSLERDIQSIKESLDKGNKKSFPGEEYPCGVCGTKTLKFDEVGPRGEKIYKCTKCGDRQGMEESKINEGYPPREEMINKLADLMTNTSKSPAEIDEYEAKLKNMSLIRLQTEYQNLYLMEKKINEKWTENDVCPRCGTFLQSEHMDPKTGYGSSKLVCGSNRCDFEVAEKDRKDVVDGKYVGESKKIIENFQIGQKVKVKYHDDEGNFDYENDGVIYALKVGEGNNQIGVNFKDGTGGEFSKEEVFPIEESKKVNEAGGASIHERALDLLAWGKFNKNYLNLTDREKQTIKKLAEEYWKNPGKVSIFGGTPGYESKEINEGIGDKEASKIILLVTELEKAVKDYKRIGAPDDSVIDEMMDIVSNLYNSYMSSPKKVEGK